MNCDEAFDALTDPHESNHSALKWHLEFCPRCREMQEVLAPALAMFSADPVGSGESSSSTSHRLLERSGEAKSRIHHLETPDPPVSKPFLTPEAIRVAEQTARALCPARKRAASRWMMAGVVCLMTVLGVFFAVQSSNPATPRGSDSPMLAEECLWTEQDSAQTQSTADQGSARWVVLSCVACHLEDSMD